MHYISNNTCLRDYSFRLKTLAQFNQLFYTMLFPKYTTPQPGVQFSAEYFAQLTVFAVDYLVENECLPVVLAKMSIEKWLFDKSIPTAVENTFLAEGELVPCLDDLLQVTNNMEIAYNVHGAHSVVIQFAGMPQPVHYHLSKV
jgi:hypothetical protein